MISVKSLWSIVAELGQAGCGGVFDERGYLSLTLRVAPEGHSA